MSHEEMRDRLLDLLYGELPPREARKVEEHAASCEACGAELARMRGTRKLMASLPDEPAPERGERILLAAAREAARRRAPRPWVPRWAWATAVAAASLVAVAAVSYRIVAMRPGGIGREDPQALMGDSPYAREPREGAPRHVPEAQREEQVGSLGSAPERRLHEAAPAPEKRKPGRAAEAGPRRAAPSERFAQPPPPEAAPAAPERSAPEDRSTAAARPHRAMSAEAAPPQGAADGEGGVRAEASRAPAAPPSAGAGEKASAPAAPAAVLRYQELRGAGRLRGEIRTFPGCEGEAWRKVERDPGGRVVSYAREGLFEGRRVRVDVIYGPDGAPARVTVRDAASSAPLDPTGPWIPRAAEADGPPRCGR